MICALSSRMIPSRSAARVPGSLPSRACGEGEQVLGAAAVLGQRVGELLGGELLPRRGHPRRSFGRAPRLGTPADQLGGRGQLPRGHVRLQPVPRAQHPDQLIIGGALVGVVISGRRIREHRQVRAARHHIQDQPGAERRRPATRLAREPARRPGLPRAPAACQRRERGQRPGRPRPGRRSRRPRFRLGGLSDRGDLLRRQLVLTRRRRPFGVGVLLRVGRLSQVIQPGLALLLGHRIRPGHRRLPARRLILHRVAGGLRRARGSALVRFGRSVGRRCCHLPSSLDIDAQKSY